MKNKGWFIRLTHQQLSAAMAQCIVGCCGVALALMMTGAAVAQNPNPEAAKPGPEVSAPNGYTIHHSVDLGGRIANDQSPGRGRGGSALLDGVGQLVREDEVPRKRTGPILAGSEADMLPIRERPGSKPPRKSRGPVVRVDLDATETMAQAPLHPGPDVSVEGLAGAELE